MGYLPSSKHLQGRDLQLKRGGQPCTKATSYMRRTGWSFTFEGAKLTSTTKAPQGITFKEVEGCARSKRQLMSLC